MGKINNRESFRVVQTVLLVLFIATTSFLFIEDVYADERDEILELVNEERAKHSLQPLKMDKDLEKAAKIRNDEIMTVFSHTRPNGSKFFTVSHKAKSENLAAGQKTPKEVVSAWMESPGHRKNILNPDSTIIGISYKKTNTGYKNYWVQLFGAGKSKKITIEKVNGVKVESTNNQVTLRWNKQTSPRITGYKISQYNFKTKKYQLLKKITNSSVGGLIVTGLKSSTNYKYQIKSYRVIDKKVIYSAPSRITARTKN